MVDAKRLRELFSYDRLTGEFTRIIPRPGYAAGGLAGGVTPEGYLAMMIDGKSYQAHRLAFLYETGEWPDSEIDHIDGNKLNNRIANLRQVSRQVNNENLRSARRDNKLGLLGVSQAGNRFVAQIQVAGKKMHLGQFDTAEEAHEAYLTVKRELHAGCTL